MKDLKILVWTMIFLTQIYMESCNLINQREDGSRNTALLMIMLLMPASLRIQNNTGISQTYNLIPFSSSFCNNNSTFSFRQNPIPNGSTSEYESIPNGAFTIGNPPAGCLQGPYRFLPLVSYTCIDDFLTFTCSSP